MTAKKIETFVFEGLGFPVVLINAPWRKVLGEWALDINFNKLQIVVLEALIHKSIPLTGDELRFIRKFLEKSTTEFGKLFGVSHVAVVKWENNKARINPSTEVCVRLYIMNHLCHKDKEFRKFYLEIIENMDVHKKTNKIYPIKIDAKEQLLAC